ncbi:MAG: DUF456 domain-containing protein [Bacteroidales bacterium]|nr:DUF456 domain-containing protein [Bacteroidales bacterium]
MESADVILMVIGFVCMVVGLLGGVLPGLPGTPLSYVGVLLLHFTHAECFSMRFLVGWGIAVVVIQVLDYLIPIWGTKRFGGGKAGTIGCTIGLVAGLFGGPLGIILFPFIGAVIGEMLADKPFNLALKAGFGAFLGFLAGVLLKATESLVLFYYFVVECIKMLA